MQRTTPEVGRRLKTLRELLGLSQSQLAKKLGVAQNTLSQWERGERDIPTSVLLKLHSIAGVNLHWLLTGEGEPFVKPSDEDRELMEMVNSIPEEYKEQFKEIFKSILFIAGLERAKKNLEKNEKSISSTKSSMA